MNENENKKFNAFIKLALWGVFIAFILAFIYLSNNANTSDNKENNKIEEKVNQE